MKINSFVIKTDDFTFNVDEYNHSGEVSYEVIIAEPVGFAVYYKIEQPVKMCYDIETNNFKWYNQDLGMQELESLLSKHIINWNQ